MHVQGILNCANKRRATTSGLPKIFRELCLSREHTKTSNGLDGSFVTVKSGLNYTTLGMTRGLKPTIDPQLFRFNSIRDSRREIVHPGHIFRTYLEHI